jgi:hypothetical protein
MIRRPVLVTFVTALLLRIVASSAVRVLRDGVLFLDDGAYLRLAQGYARGGRAALSASQNATWNSLRSFLFPLGWVGDFVSSDPLAFSLMTALAGSLVAAGVAWLVRRRLGDRFALVAGLAVAMMPSQVLWSSLILRDAYSWLALVALALLIGVDGPRSRRLAAWIVVPLVLVYLDGIRGHTFIVASMATAAALIFHFRRHVLTIGLAVVALGTLALVSGTVDRITSILETGTSGRQEELTAAVDAGKTTIACVVVPFVYEAPSDGVGWSGDLQCLPSGLRMMLFDPFPNQLGKSISLLPPFLENVIWYPLLFLAARGLRRLRGWRTQDVFVLASAIGTLFVWSLVDRNFGTGFRHRGEFFWAVAYFAAIGLHHTVMERTVKPGAISGRIRARLVPDEPRCSHRSR